MRKTRPLALVGAGPVSRSFLAHLPAVAEHLGPVKSFSFRLASRIANALRAGFPVADYAELDHSRMILLSLPARSLGRMLAELVAAPIDWRHKTVILCDAEGDSSALAALASRGAATASLAPLEGFDLVERILIEGDPLALAAARRLLAHGDVKLVELQRGAKAVYLAGTTFLTTFSAPLLAAAGDCLRLAGLSPQLANQVVDRLSQRALRTYLGGGGKAWAEVSAGNELAALERIKPELAASYADAVRLVTRARRRGKTRAAAAS
jgi:predicted short-subunit dehydrogenase-like oxidoreductase (DUF2520 family)